MTNNNDANAPQQDAKSPDELKKELLDAVDEMDRAAANVRRVIFSLRPHLWTRRERPN